MVSIRVYLDSDHGFHLGVGERHAGSRAPRPIVLGSRQNQQLYNNGVSVRSPAATIQCDARGQLAAPGRELLSPWPKVIVVPRRIDRAAGAMRPADYRDAIGPDIRPPGQHVSRCERVLRTLRA